MTNPRVPQSPSPSSQRVQLPAVAVVLLVATVILLPLGFLTLMGTSSRSFFENAPTQASIGALMLLIGAGALIGALVLVGVRSIVQQHIDVLLDNSPGSR